MSNDPVTVEVSRLIRLLGSRYGEQATFARALALSGSAISSWKTMKVRPEPGRWPEIEEFFGLDAGHLRRIESGEVAPGEVQPTSFGHQFVVPEAAGLEPIVVEGSGRDRIGRVDELFGRLDRIDKELKKLGEIEKALVGLVQVVEQLAQEVQALPRPATGRGRGGRAASGQ